MSTAAQDLTCFCGPGGSRFVGGTYPLQFTLPCGVTKDPLQTQPEEGCVEILPDIPQHVLQTSGKNERQSGWDG